jgi:hypothetical protein
MENSCSKKQNGTMAEPESVISPSLPKGFLWCHLLTLGVGMLSQAGVLLYSLSSAFLSSASVKSEWNLYLWPLSFLLLQVLYALILAGLYFWARKAFYRVFTFLFAPRKLWKDFLYFLFGQGCGFLLLVALLSSLFRGTSDLPSSPLALSCFFLALESGLFLLYPLFWGLEEHEEDSPVLLHHVKPLSFILYRVLFLTLNGAFAGLSVYFFVMNLLSSSGDSLIVPIFSSLFFFALFVLGLVFLKKKRFERVFAFFAYSPTLLKNLFLALAGLPFGLSLFYFGENWQSIWEHSTLPAVLVVDVLFILFGVLPLLLLRYPYPKKKG